MTPRCRAASVDGPTAPPTAVNRVRQGGRSEAHGSLAVVAGGVPRVCPVRVVASRNLDWRRMFANQGSGISRIAPMTEARQRCRPHSPVTARVRRAGVLALALTLLLAAPAAEAQTVMNPSAQRRVAAPHGGASAKARPPPRAERAHGAGRAGGEPHRNGNAVDRRPRQRRADHRLRDRAAHAAVAARRARDAAADAEAR